MYDIIAIFTTNEFDNYCLSDKIIASIIIIILNIILIPINIIITILLILNRIFSYQNIKSIGYLLSALIYFSIISIYFTILTIPPINIIKIVQSNDKISCLNKENERLLSLITEQNKMIEDITLD